MFRAMRNFLLGSKTAQVNKPADWLRAVASAEQWDVFDITAAAPQLDMYRKLTWVQIAISAVSRLIASTSLEVFQLVGEEEKEISNHPFEVLLRRPNPLHSRFEFLFATSSILNLTGNAYWWLNRSSENAPIEEIWVLPGGRVTPVPDERMYLKGYMLETENARVPLELWEVAHFRLFNPQNSFVGLSPIEALSVTARGDLAMNRWNTAYFDKDNAKVPGALAFADPIEDDTWQTMKEEIAQEYGGTRRKLMMLRNVGTGGVSWIPMAMSQSDMQFLESRTANKEEIFAMFAPGLASVLDVNATEANAIAGRATFVEMAVWPMMQLLAEKITNDVLPAFGDDLVCSFEDIRRTDRAMELQEIARFSETHTIDEVRAKFWSDEALPDARGALLIAEVGKGMTDARDPTELAAEQAARDEANRQLEMEKLAAGAQQSQQAGVQDVANTPANNEAPSDGTNTQGAPPDNLAELQKIEAKALRSWLKKRGASADLSKFELNYLSPDEAMRIQKEVGDAEGATFRRKSAFAGYP